MVDWWTLANENLLQEHVPFRIVAEGVRKSNTALRPGVKEMCAFLQKQDVPMMVFSAGLGGACVVQYDELKNTADVLLEMLRYCGVPISDNMRTCLLLPCKRSPTQC